MSHTFLLVASEAGVGLTTISLGMLRAIDRLGIPVGFCKPIRQRDRAMEDHSVSAIRRMTSLHVADPISPQRVESLLASGQHELLMEEVIRIHRHSAEHADTVIVEGLIDDGHTSYAARLNADIAQTLDAEVILVALADQNADEHLALAAEHFAAHREGGLIGIIANKFGQPAYATTGIRTGGGIEANTHANNTSNSFQTEQLCRPLIGSIPWQEKLIAPRTSDVAAYLHAELINPGDMQTRRVQRIEMCARTLANINVFHPNVLLVFAGDRDDVFVAACMAALNGIKMAGIVLTSKLQPSPAVTQLCVRAMASGLPVLMVGTSSYQTVADLVAMPLTTANDDLSLIDAAMNHVADHLDDGWLRHHCVTERHPRLSPAAFRYSLIQQAKQRLRRIILPEGTEPRTLQAAQLCYERGIAIPVLLGQPSEVSVAAMNAGINLSPDIPIITPQAVRHRYVAAMLQLRQHKGMTEGMAQDQLQDNVVLATMMLALNEADGLVSGAEHTTANTVRPAFQFIGAAENAQLVSSIFFMCLPDQVVVYGDCAINPDPNASQLADIAIQSAASAMAFGIQPRVAMISYSTGSSGSGDDVEKVRQATAIAKQRCPELLIDGPMQYDAAAVASVGRSKAPQSHVAGQATVFVFPDLNTGNTTYKAVQRSAHVTSIGPMLQGLKKPVNDLSRGATVEDILYTIALTAIQADKQADAPLGEKNA